MGGNQENAEVCVLGCCRVLHGTVCVLQIWNSVFVGKDFYDGDKASEDPALKERYQNELSWAMMCNVVYLGVQFANSKLCEMFTIRWMCVFWMLVFCAFYVSFS